MTTLSKNFGFGDEERMVRDAARKLLGERAAVAAVRNLVAGDHEPSRTPVSVYDQALWRQIAELGWPAIPVPEPAGGADMKMVAVAAVAEEVGRHALPSPLLASWFAAFALRAAGTPAAANWLERIAEGQPAALAITNADGDWELARSGVSARAHGDGVVLSGRAGFVQDGGKASFFVVSAASEAGPGLYIVPRDATGLTVRLDQIYDLTRDQATLDFDDVAVGADAIAAAPGTGLTALGSAEPAILTAVAADLVGACEWLLQTTVEYAKTRTQFDHPIGFFQAVKHPIVDMMVAIDQARSLVYAAACALDEDPGDAARLAHMAKAHASDTARYCSGRAVQLHGGIAFTWECDVHLFFKRCKHNQFLFGDGSHHRARLADLLLGPAA